MDDLLISRPESSDVRWAECFPHHVDLPPPDAPLDERQLPTHGGVFAFVGEGDRIEHVMAAESIRRTVGGRLHATTGEEPNRRTDLRAITRRIAWCRTSSRFETTLAFLTISRRLWPRTYRRRLSFGPAYFATVDLDARLPRWRVDSYAWGSGKSDVGPFRQRKQCLVFVELLEDLFDLCRDYAILEQTPAGRPCSYFDMGRCPAPCDGSVSLADYRAMMASAYRFAVGEHQERLTVLSRQMRSAAEGREFARAQRIKELLDRTEKELRRSRPITHTPDAFRYLIVQRGHPRSKVVPFFVRGGHIETGEPTRLDGVPDCVTEWFERVRSRIDEPTGNPTDRSEHIWLVSHFLGKGDKAPGLFIHVDELTTPDNFAALVRKKFGRVKEGEQADADAMNC